MVLFGDKKDENQVSTHFSFSFSFRVLAFKHSPFFRYRSPIFFSLVLSVAESNPQRVNDLTRARFSKDRVQSRSKFLSFV